MRSGLTLIELLVVIGVLSVLFAITSINLVTPQRRTSTGEMVAVLTSDLRSQQLKAMLGDASGSAPDSYGIYFDSDGYVLFTGPGYSGSDPDNFRVSLTPGFIFSGIDFPASVIVFSRGSGEAGNFVAGAYALALTDSQNNQTTTIIVNRYGTLTQAD